MAKALRGDMSRFPDLQARLTIFLNPDYIRMCVWGNE
jgi:hypothetical protein